MSEFAEQLKGRTFAFAVSTFHLCTARLKQPDARIPKNQLIRASASVASNYRAACRGRSASEFIAKLGTVIEEADEALFWLDFLRATGLLKPDPEWQRLRTESDELVAILTASYKTSKARQAAAKRHSR
jgi:four helix bundle protein